MSSEQLYICSNCNESKHVFEFTWEPNICNDCRKAYHRAYYRKNKSLIRDKYLERTYGLSPEQYEKLLTEQNGLCAICQKTEAHHVDHNHENGQVRGLLCSSCNLGLGHFKDDVALLSNAIHYLNNVGE